MTVTVYHDDEQPMPIEVQRVIDSIEELVERRLTDRPEMRVEFHGIAASMMIDRQVYRVIKQEKPEVPSLWFHLSVVNFTEEKLDLRFDTHQPYEVVIRNEPGEEVLRWSDGKDFDLEPTEVALVTDWVSYVDSIPLRGVEGGPLPPGRYTLAYEILAEPVYRGETSFRIEYIDPPEKKQSFKGILARHRAATKGGSEAPGKAGGKAAGKSGGKGAGKGGGKAGKKKKGGG
jgi:hypothetical protein